MDIVDENNPMDIEFEEPFDILNVALRPGLKEGEDYLLLDKDTWAIFSSYEAIEVRRRLEQTSDGKKVEVYFRRVLSEFTKIGAICLYNELLKSVETERIAKFTRLQLQLPQYHPIGDELMQGLSEKVKSYIKSHSNYSSFRYNDSGFGQEKLKVWKIEEDMSQTKFFDHLLKGCRSCRSLSYRMHFPGCFVDLENQAIINTVLTPESTVVFELKEKKEDWIFFTKDHLI